MNTKHWLGASLGLWVGVFALPWMAVSPLEWEETVAEADVVEVGVSLTTAPVGDGDLVLQVLEGETVVEMTLEDYLVGVLRAEMPASFHIEALKAQACAARTYTLYQMEQGTVHGGVADVCTDYTCCQAYTDSETAALEWGYQATTYESRIRSAVYQTSGQTIDYEGSPILAVFHASSAGQTRQAGQVWVTDLPYLQSVDSPESADTVPDYITQVTYSAQELQEKLLTINPQLTLGDDPTAWLQEGEREVGGSVISVTVAGQPISGTTLRGALGLRSASFTWAWIEDVCTFTVTGYGHGVGLSQYGANAMAEAGADYIDILTHYYTGVDISTESVSAMAQALLSKD